MLDAALDQGAGLRLQTPQSTPRIAGLVAQGDTDTELPLLWQLCDALQTLGYQVAVLDAHSAESADTPGLRELLEGSLGMEDGAAQADDWTGMAVLPAAAGLARLVAPHGGDPLPAAPARLARVLRPYDMVLLYAAAPLLARWARYCGMTPVLAAAPRQSGVLAAYQSLKALVDAGVVPTVASVVTRAGVATAGTAQAARENLARCADAWLGCRLDVLRVRTSIDGERASGDVQRLALRLIEGAATLSHANASSYGLRSAVVPAIHEEALPAVLPIRRSPLARAFDRSARSH